MPTVDFERAYDLFKPRKATVIDSRPGEVRLRLWRDDAEAASWFPSVFSTTPIGTDGVLIRVNREESMFVPYDFIVSTPGSAAWGSITGTMSSQTDLMTALNGKSNTGHNHDGTYSPVSHTHTWGSITGKPSTFPPSAHSHVLSDVTNAGDLAGMDTVGVPEIDATGTPGATTYLRGDGTWTTPPNTNTTYAEITESEITTGTASTARAISGRRAQAIVNKARTDLETTTQLNARDTANRSRANHTGTQLAATISDLAATVAAHTDVAANTSARHTHSNKTTLDAVTAAYTTAEKTKLSGVAAGATKNATDAQLRARSSHTGTQLAATISDFSTTVASHSAVAANTSARHTHSNKSVLDSVTAAYTTAMNTKLSGIATGATKNQADAYLLNRGNHTGNQAINTITNLQEILDGKPLVVDVGNRSTAIGVDAQAIGASSFAAGDTAIAGGVNSIAIGVDSDASGLGSAAIGQGAEASGQSSIAVGLGTDASGDNTTALGNYAAASDEGATAVGGAASASGVNATAVGFLSEATGSGSSAMGVSAEAHGQSSNAIGSDARVPATSPRSQAFGAGVVIPENKPDTTVIGAKSLEIKPSLAAIGNNSTITLYDAAGNPRTIGATPGALTYDGVAVSKVGHIHSISDMPSLQPALNGKANTSHTHDDRYYTETEVNSLLTGKANTSHTHDDRYYTEAEVDALLAAKQTHFGHASGSPLAENTTLVVSTFSQAKSLWLTTLGDLIPETASGTWTVKMSTSMVVNRSVTTGGVYMFRAINGSTTATASRGFAQDGAYTIVRTYVISGCTGASELEVRYGGQATAGQTNVWGWDVDITAVRTG